MINVIHNTMCVCDCVFVGVMCMHVVCVCVIMLLLNHAIRQGNSIEYAPNVDKL